MHLYIVTRGIKHDVDRFITELQGKYLPFRYPDKDNKLVPCAIQLSVRPIEFYELAYPEESHKMIMNTLFPETIDGQHGWYKSILKMIRKMLKLEELNKVEKTDTMPIYKNNIEIVGVGLKKDYFIHTKKGRIDNPTEEEKKDCYEGI